jgi:hypothetical protein
MSIKKLPLLLAEVIIMSSSVGKFNVIVWFLSNLFKIESDSTKLRYSESCQFINTAEKCGL